MEISTRSHWLYYVKESRVMRPYGIFITTTRCGSPFYLQSGPLLDYLSHLTYKLGVEHIFQVYFSRLTQPSLLEGCLRQSLHAQVISITFNQSSKNYRQHNHPKVHYSLIHLIFVHMYIIESSSTSFLLTFFDTR